jgi:FkbM family methyltransferase
MSFVSYAQNLEDVMLWRALKHVDGGFYIDVGANDPAIDSVTKAFYERGWHGINVEPLQLHCDDLRTYRDRDINLQCAAGAESGEIELWECDVRGWASASQDVVAQHRAGGHDGVFKKVPVRRLTEICEEFVRGDIHFLKIDVEGFEAEVIKGLDLSRFRPWILVIEATRPNSTEEVHRDWEGIVLGADYSLAYCDGLNRFYVSKEHSELLQTLRYPPNVFDDYVRFEQHCAVLNAQQAEARAQIEGSRAEQLEARALEAEARAQIEGSRAEQLEARALEAEERAQIEGSRADQLEARALEAEERAQSKGSRAGQLEARALEAEARAQSEAARAVQLEARALQAEERAQRADAGLEQCRAEIEALGTANHHHWLLANERGALIDAMHGSHSWRLTAPLRAANSILTRVAHLSRLRQLATDPASHAILYVSRRPRLKHLAMRALPLFPGLGGKILAKRTMLMMATKIQQRGDSPDLEVLAPRSKEMFRKLQTAIERSQKG